MFQVLALCQTRWYFCFSFKGWNSIQVCVCSQRYNQPIPAEKTEERCQHELGSTCKEWTGLCSTNYHCYSTLPSEAMGDRFTWILSLWDTWKRKETCKVIKLHGLLERFSIECPQLLWFCFTTLCDWSRNLAPPSQPIRCKTKTNHDLVTRVFPRLRPVTSIYFEVSLAPSEIVLCSDWPLWLHWFWFYDTQSKSALIISKW